MTNNNPSKKDNYRIILRWDDVPAHLGQKAATEIEQGFSRRTWHHNVVCKWNGNNNTIIIEAENDFDKQGLALMDEFSDEISACVKDAGDGGIQVVSVTKV